MESFLLTLIRTNAQNRSETRKAHPGARAVQCGPVCEEPGNASRKEDFRFPTKEQTGFQSEKGFRDALRREQRARRTRVQPDLQKDRKGAKDETFL